MPCFQVSTETRCLIPGQAVSCIRGMGGGGGGGGQQARRRDEERVEDQRSLVFLGHLFA